jgi:hypothetical protein
LERLTALLLQGASARGFTGDLWTVGSSEPYEGWRVRVLHANPTQLRWLAAQSKDAGSAHHLTHTRPEEFPKMRQVTGGRVVGGLPLGLR